MEQFYQWLKTLAVKGGSDLYLTVGAQPVAKFEGQIKALGPDKLNNDAIRKIAEQIMSPDQQADFERKPEMNLALSRPGVGRFRVNIFMQRNSCAMVIRNIQTDIPQADDLGLPEVLKKVIMEKRGLVLFVGGTGSGKSTSLAALIDHRNRNATGHIITIEDPIEYVHPHKRSIINQREVGVDTDSYEDALKNTLRQAPDVILIGEIRAQETMEHAIAFAETGHLCLSTLHANNSNQALDRIINFFPEERKNQLLLDLSLNVKAFVSQRLVRTKDGKRTAAIEIMLTSELIRDLIKDGDVGSIKEVMEKSANIGMQTFDMDLFRLYRDGIISYDEAIANSDSPNNLKLKIKLEGGTPVSDAPEPVQQASSAAPRSAPLELELEKEQEPEEDDTPVFMRPNQ